ncbi:MAG: DUF1292 domain-containing protein [Clostridia bacterium]|nr:DUF1292 domain-containing protein [Clostridia bacterium]MBR6646004.1 DUF1292 domain-containing protein [Clostridia bacterium]
MAEDLKNINPEEQEETNIVTLLDGDGNPHEFEHLDTFELNGETYALFVPAPENEDDEIEEVIIFSVREDENGEDAFFLIEDEAELDMVFEEFKRRAEEDFNFVD